MPHRFGSGGFKTARFYGTWRSPVNAQANARAGAFDSTLRGRVPFRMRNALLLPGYRIRLMERHPVDFMMVLATLRVDDAGGNRTNSVPTDCPQMAQRRLRQPMRQTVADGTQAASSSPSGRRRANKPSNSSRLLNCTVSWPRPFAASLICTPKPSSSASSSSRRATSRPP